MKTHLMYQRNATSVQNKNTMKNVDLLNLFLPMLTYANNVKMAYIIVKIICQVFGELSVL